MIEPPLFNFMDYSNVIELNRAVTTPGLILDIEILLDHHNISNPIWLDIQTKLTPELIALPLNDYRKSFIWLQKQL